MQYFQYFQKKYLFDKIHLTINIKFAIINIEVIICKNII
nr:MAG TPA: hypothetical protein [Caudoviricetes sp.]